MLAFTSGATQAESSRCATPMSVISDDLLSNCLLPTRSRLLPHVSPIFLPIPNETSISLPCSELWGGFSNVPAVRVSIGGTLWTNWKVTCSINRLIALSFQKLKIILDLLLHFHQVMFWFLLSFPSAWAPPWSLAHAMMMEHCSTPRHLSVHLIVVTFPFQPWNFLGQKLTVAPCWLSRV